MNNTQYWQTVFENLTRCYRCNIWPLIKYPFF